MNPKRSKAMTYVFFMPFFLIGLALLGLAAHQVVRHFGAQAWVQVPAMLLSEGVSEQTNSLGRPKAGGATRIAGRYAYTWEGRRLESEQLSFSLARTREWGAAPDDWDERLAALMNPEAGPMQAWVNPSEPTEAVVLRAIRWLELGAMLGFGLLLVCSSALFLWGGNPHAASAGFSWRTVGLMAVVGLPLAVLAPLLWQDGHPIWAGLVLVPLFLAVIGTFNGLFRR